MRRMVLMGSLLSLISTAYADTFFCPNNFKYIHTGQNIVDVVNACGEPTQKEQKDEAIQLTKPVQQLYYQLNAGASGDTRIDLVFTIENDKVASMTIAGKEVNSTTMCGSGGLPIKVGSSVYELTTSCGEPVAVNETTVSVPSGKISKVENWNYDFGAYKPKVRLKFVNGILQEIQQ